jgi:membrane protein required for beta-lactamase induction
MPTPVDFNELKKKFPAKRKIVYDAGKGPLHKKSTKAAVKAIAREYEMKKAELQGSAAPLFKKGPLFYGVVILVLIIVGSLVLGGLKNGVSFS